MSRNRLLAWLETAGPRHGALLALLALVLGNAFYTPHFATAGNLQNILVQAASAILVGAGMTLVLATGGVDLSVGSVMALSAGVAAVTLPTLGPIGAGLAGLLAGAAVGLFNGVVITRYRIEPFVATLGTMTAVRGLAQAVCGGAGAAPLESPGFEQVLGKGSIGPVPVPVVLAAAGVLFAAAVLRLTPLGRYLLAVGGNPRAAWAAGVPVRRSVALAFVASGTLAGLAGLTDAARLGAADPVNLGGMMEFIAVAGAVIGGTPLRGGRARPLGTAAGVLILGVIGAAFNMNAVPFAYGQMLQAGLILAAVAVQRPRRG